MGTAILKFFALWIGMTYKAGYSILLLRNLLYITPDFWQLFTDKSYHSVTYIDLCFTEQEGYTSYFSEVFQDRNLNVGP